MKALRFLQPYFARQRSRLVWGLAAIFASALIGLVTPMLVGSAVDALKTGLSANLLLAYGGLVVGIAIVRGVFTFLQRMILVTMSRDIELELRDRYFQQLEGLSARYFNKSATGDLMARGTNDLSAVRLMCGPAIMYAANTLFTFIGALVLMLGIDPWLTLVALAPMPIVAVVTKFVGDKIHHHFERVQENFSALTTRVQENLAGVRVVRAYAQERGEEARFDELNREAVERNRRLATWNAAFHPLLQALVGLGFVAVLGYGGLLTVRGTITVGQFVTFNLFLSKMIWPMIAIGYVINLVQRGTASLTRLRDVIDTEPDIADPAEPVFPSRLLGDVAIRDLTFAYEPDGPSVLQSIRLDAPAGSTVAVVGKTGAGKSTLLALLPRLWDPPKETVFLDGIDVRALPLSELRGAIAVVPQESFLFSTTLADNIGFGRPGASRDEITQAALQAGLGADLAGFPQGLDTVVGERGITLSGGQKQRVALARAILKSPRVLILDDSLSAVDTQTEETILANLRTVFQGRTVFLVSHRVSTVQHADQILVLADGRIAERGTHAELLAAGGHYAELALRQRLEAELAAVR